MKKFLVGTFYSDGYDGDRKGATGYTRYYNKNWPGCIEYEIEAKSGREAVKIACKMRKERETNAS